MTKIVADFPPIFAMIKASFPQAGVGNVFAYGDTIYVPSGHTELPEHLLAHEETHFRQQRDVGGPDQWWLLYCDDRQFRFEQEVEAYRAQWAVISQLPERPRRRELLAKIVRDLASGLYGLQMSKEQARKLITA